ncbi:MAG TPA: hypothetical protein VGL70_13825 [Candidatus Binatia bacterium]|jgi:hypothetical protein
MTDMERTFPEDCKHGGQAPNAALRLYVPVRSPFKAHPSGYGLDVTLAASFFFLSITQSSQFKIQN